MTDESDLLAGYISDEEMAKKRDLTIRTLRGERQRGDGPPFVKIGKTILYPIAGFRDWLKSIERRPVRAGKVAA